MLKRYFWFFFILPMLFVFGCNSTATDNTISPGAETSLAIGKSVSINGENLTIKFLAVTEDSRCPTGAQCIWAGRAICKIQVTDSSGTSEVLLTQAGGSGDYVKQDVGKYHFSFNVTPYPAVSKTIADEEYRLHLIVSL